MSEKTTFILGAGFSKTAGVPLASEFQKLILSINEDGKDYNKNNPLGHCLLKMIKLFYKNVYGFRNGKDLTFPSLEDVFTSLDLSINDNSYLYFSPRQLEAVRKALVYNLFQIVVEQKRDEEGLNQIVKLLSKYPKANFVVINWDTVLEKALLKTHENINIDYGFPIYPWKQRSVKVDKTISVSKLHGSCNWLYCDKCRRCFYDLKEEIAYTQQVDILLSDIRLFRSYFEDNYKLYEEKFKADRKKRKELKQEKNGLCGFCKTKLSSRIATFSYNKDFNTNIYPAIWESARKSLQDAENWIFIGYSLPEADFMVQYLLKSSQFSKRKKGDKTKETKITVIDKGDSAKIRYINLFGKEIDYHGDGLSEYIKKLN